MRDRMRFCVPCLFGVEGPGGSRAAGDGTGRGPGGERTGAVFRRMGGHGQANLNSRFGERVLLLGEFPARSFEELFQG